MARELCVQVDYKANRHVELAYGEQVAKAVVREDLFDALHVLSRVILKEMAFTERSYVFTVPASSLRHKPSTEC
jgi:hypothetical protein